MHTDKVNWMQNESQNKRYIHKWQFPAEVEYRSRFGAQTIARFLQVMPVLSLNDAIRDKCRIRNAQVLCNNNSSNIGSTVHTIARLYNNRSLTSTQNDHTKTELTLHRWAALASRKTVMDTVFLFFLTYYLHMVYMTSRDTLEWPWGHGENCVWPGGKADWYGLFHPGPFRQDNGFLFVCMV